MARAAINVSDKGYRQLMQNIGEAKGKTLIRAGVFAGPPRDPERSAQSSAPQLTNAEVAAIHEFGLGHVPERSFIRATVDEDREAIHDRLREVGGGIFKGRAEVEHDAKLFGEWFVGEMKRRIRAGIQPPDSPETIERKGSTTPLIDSGQLWSSLTYDVKRGAK